MKIDIKYPLLEEAGAEGGGNDFQEEIRRLAAPDGSITESEGDDSEGGEQKPAGGTQKPAGEEFKPSSDWELVKGLEGFTMPENLSKENETELLKPWIAKKYGINVEAPVLHPLAKQIQDMATENPNITINDLVSDVSSQYVDASKMSVDQKIEFDLFARYGEYHETDNPTGITKEDVDDYISKMTKIQKNEAAKLIDKGIEEYNKSLTEKFQAERAVQFEKQYETITKALDTAFTELADSLTKVDTVFGIPVSQEDHKMYLEEFKRLSVPDKTTGERGLDAILSNDVTLYKMFLLATKFGEEKVIEMITKGRESGKEELLKKLKLTPTFTGTRQRSAGPETLEAELDALRRPAN